MRPWRSHGNERLLAYVFVSTEQLQCGRGGATEMRMADKLAAVGLVSLQCGRGGATEMSTEAAIKATIPLQLQCGRGGATEMSSPAAGS